MSSVTEYEIDWRTERLAKQGAGPAASRDILGVAKAGWVFTGGTDISIQPFTGDTGSSQGFALPLAGIVTKMQIQVISNSLSGASTLTLRKNETDTALSISIAAGQTGLLTATGSIPYTAGDRLDFHLVTGGLAVESIDIVSISVVYELQ